MKCLLGQVQQTVPYRLPSWLLMLFNCKAVCIHFHGFAHVLWNVNQPPRRCPLSSVYSLHLHTGSRTSEIRDRLGIMPIRDKTRFTTTKSTGCTLFQKTTLVLRRMAQSIKNLMVSLYESMKGITYVSMDVKITN